MRYGAWRREALEGCTRSSVGKPAELFALVLNASDSAVAHALALEGGLAIQLPDVTPSRPTARGR